MDRRERETIVFPDNTRSSVSVHRNSVFSRTTKSHDHSKNNGSYKRNRHHKYLLPVTLCLTSIATAPATLAETVGGVSATASPVANSSAQSPIRQFRFYKDPILLTHMVVVFNVKVLPETSLLM